MPETILRNIISWIGLLVFVFKHFLNYYLIFQRLEISFNIMAPFPDPWKSSHLENNFYFPYLLVGILLLLFLFLFSLMFELSNSKETWVTSMRGNRKPLCMSFHACIVQWPLPAKFWSVQSIYLFESCMNYTPNLQHP